jgi:hypothetical protein
MSATAAQNLLAGGNDLGKLAFRFLVDFADAGTGEDVVEFVAEHHPPLRLERYRRRANGRPLPVGAAGESRSRNRPPRAALAASRFEISAVKHD